MAGSFVSGETGGRPFIIGTAGHVDHGKTSLIRALTGAETDRLREEQERGMSIDLGFAEMTLPGGRCAGVIDVPGHERFLKNMLAGASGIDLVLMVIAADEGVMPQTREHLDILSVLNAHSGLVAVTKSDMVEPEWLEMVLEDIREQLSGTFLADAPLLPVSSPTGGGIPELLAELDRLADQVETRPVVGPWRLPIDRVFTIAGFGTVVTGTLVAGIARVGDRVVLQPGNVETRIRGLQVHGRSQNFAEAGSRVAMNLPGLEVEELQRGWVAAPPGAYRPTQALDLRLEVLEGAPRPVKNRTRVRVYSGTAEVLARLTLLESDQIEPGSSGLVQLRLEEPLVAARGDRCVLRFFSPMATIGGGTIIDADPPRHRRLNPEVVAGLIRREQGTPDELVAEFFQRAPVTGASPAAAAQELSMRMEEIQPILNRLLSQETLQQVDAQHLAHRDRLAAGENLLLTQLDLFHSSHPMRAGMSREELRSRTARSLDSKAFALCLSRLDAAGRIGTSGARVHLASHLPQFTPRQQEMAAAITLAMKADLFNPPARAEILARFPAAEAEPVWEALADNGDLVRIGPDIFLHQDAVQQAIDRVREHLGKTSQMTAANFRDMLGTSRKFAVPLMEHLDSLRVTRRQGDYRVLAGAA